LSQPMIRLMASWMKVADRKLRVNRLPNQRMDHRNLVHQHQQVS
jgi:hypothetical protein